nr:protein SENSITIVE TO PROTON RHIZOTOXICITY 1-like [Ipomoea batatas]
MSLEFRVPLLNLANVQAKMDSLQKFLSTSVTSNILLSEEQIGMVPIEISTTIHRIIVNDAALITSTQAADYSQRRRPPCLCTFGMMFSSETLGSDTDFFNQN